MFSDVPLLWSFQENLSVYFHSTKMKKILNPALEKFKIFANALLKVLAAYLGRRFNFVYKIHVQTHFLFCNPNYSVSVSCLFLERSEK